MKSSPLIRQAGSFFLAGILAVITDYFVYNLTFNNWGIILAKLYGFYSGVIVSFLINSSFTFSKNGKALINFNYFLKYFLILSLRMIINVSVNYFIVNSFITFSNILFIGFTVATFFSMVFNFLLMKFWVFK